MSLFTQMFEFMLNPVKGWPHQAALDYHAKAASGVTIRAGMACSLNAAGELVPGVVRHRMGMFAFTSGNEFDVSTNYGGQWHVQIPQGNLLCLVATGAYELQTTEFDSAQTYNINDPLRAESTGANAGKLTNAGVVLASQTNTPATSSTAVVGIVSRPVARNAYGKNVLSFWPVWYPGRATE